MRALAIIWCTLFFLISCKSKKIDLPNLDKLAAVKDDTEEAYNTIKEVAPKVENTIKPVQKKYADILGVTPKQVQNVKLYEFIDSWMGTPYKLGGENRSGIDCSYFTQFLYHDVYDNLIERTAEKQYSAPNTDKFIGQEYLKEGDLLFFNLTGSEYDIISHVGVYLGNNRFVHSTSRRADNGSGNGVQISNFKDAHWQKLFVAAGRKPILSAKKH